MQAVFRPIDLAMYTKGLSSAFRSVIEKAGMRFEMDCAPLSQAIYIDKEMWEKIVFNLLSNAFKYTLQGLIRVTLREENDRAILQSDGYRRGHTGSGAAAYVRAFPSCARYGAYALKAPVSGFRWYVSSLFCMEVMCLYKAARARQHIYGSHTVR